MLLLLQRRSLVQGLPQICLPWLRSWSLHSDIEAKGEWFMSLLPRPKTCIRRHWQGGTHLESYWFFRDDCQQRGCCPTSQRNFSKGRRGLHVGGAQGENKPDLAWNSGGPPHGRLEKHGHRGPSECEKGSRNTVLTKTMAAAAQGTNAGRFRIPRLAAEALSA